MDHLRYLDPLLFLILNSLFDKFPEGFVFVSTQMDDRILRLKARVAGSLIRIKLWFKSFPSDPTIRLTKGRAWKLVDALSLYMLFKD